MPSAEDLVRLRHMRDAAQKAIEFTYNRNREDLETDEMLALSVVRLVEIIDEAAKNVSVEVQESNPNIPWRQIKGTRDRLAHTYFDVDFDIIWSIVSRSLEPLVHNLDRCLKGNGEL